MHRSRIVVTCLALVLGPAATARADLDGFLSGLNVQARADMHGFSVRLAAQFGVSDADVQAVIRVVDAPADAFMCFQLGHWTHKQPDVVLRTMRTGKGKGWGAIAQDLGIKPGSAEFKTLKNGDLALTGKPASTKSKGNGKSKDKEKGSSLGNLAPPPSRPLTLVSTRQFYRFVGRLGSDGSDNGLSSFAGGTRLRFIHFSAIR